MGVLDTYKPEDVRQMKAVEKTIVQAILPFKENTPTILIVLSLIRCARTVLRLATKEQQKELLPILVAFLQGRTQLPEETGDSPIWTPSSRRH